MSRYMIKRMVVCFILSGLFAFSSVGAECRLGFSAFVPDEELFGIFDELMLQQRIFLLNEDMSIATSVKTENGSYVIRDLSDPTVIYAIADSSYACLDRMSYEEILNSEQRIVRYTIDGKEKWSAKIFRKAARYESNNEIIIGLDGINTPYTIAVPDFYDESTIHISKGGEHYKEIKQCYEKWVGYEGRNSAIWKWPTDFTAVSAYDKVAVTIDDSWHAYTYLYVYDMETCTVSKIGEWYDIYGPICWYDETHILATTLINSEITLALININTAEVQPFVMANGENLSMENTPCISMVLSNDRAKLAFWTSREEHFDGVDDLTLNLLDLVSGERKTLIFPEYGDGSFEPYGQTYSREIGDTRVFIPIYDYVPSIFFME